MTAKTPTARFGWSVPELARAYSVSKQTIYREIERGALRAKKVRGKFVVLEDERRRWERALPAAPVIT